ncbi:hypothetical protein C8Q77DRAFT_1102379 [Trametes polyzona]|nr:hypothetical protein C8Q77DRAFT_1102379 [Trametes polyzona]
MEAGRAVHSLILSSAPGISAPGLLRTMDALVRLYVVRSRNGHLFPDSKHIKQRIGGFW